MASTTVSPLAKYKLVGLASPLCNCQKKQEGASKVSRPLCGLPGLSGGPVRREDQHHHPLHVR